MTVAFHPKSRTGRYYAIVVWFSVEGKAGVMIGLLNGSTAVSLRKRELVSAHEVQQATMWMPKSGHTLWLSVAVPAGGAVRQHRSSATMCLSVPGTSQRRRGKRQPPPTLPIHHSDTASCSHGKPTTGQSLWTRAGRGKEIGRASCRERV